MRSPGSTSKASLFSEDSQSEETTEIEPKFKSVLIVDDDQVKVLVAARALGLSPKNALRDEIIQLFKSEEGGALKKKQGGMDIYIAGNGSAGLNLCLQHSPEFVITDYHMQTKVNPMNGDDMIINIQNKTAANPEKRPIFYLMNSTESDSTKEAISDKLLKENITNFKICAPRTVAGCVKDLMADKSTLRR